MTGCPQIAGLSEWRPIARGGLAVVWEARQLSTDRRVAVKVYERELPEGDQHRFLRDASTGQRLSARPGIVTTYSAGILPDDRPYLVMELCPGGSLTHWLEAEGRPSEERVRQVGLQIADVLAAAHAAGVLHRDIKPANILIDSDGSPRLADFGLTVEPGAETETTDQLNANQAWAPPEALQKQPATEAGDVFSLAATLYTVLAGRPPRTTVGAPILPIPGVSRPLMQVLLAALADDPAARPSAAAFFGHLAKVPLRTSRHEAVVGAAAASAAIMPHDQVAVLASAAPDSHPGIAAALTPPTPPTPFTPIPITSAPPAPTPTAQVSTTDEPRRQRRHRLGLLALAAVLVIAVAAGTAWLVRQPASSSAPAPVPPSQIVGGQSSNGSALASSTGPSDQPPGPGDDSQPAVPADKSIRLEDSAVSANAFEAARLRGTYPGEANTLLRVQRWEDDAWLTFPVPTRTDQSGQFVAYVELGQPGRYRLRILDPSSGTTSEPVVLTIKG